MMISYFDPDDHVLVEKLCLEKYKFSHGDVVMFRSPSNYKEKYIKRLVALPGDIVNIPRSFDRVKIPEGHCWVEGDNSDCSCDSRSYGAIPLGLLQGRATHVVWPPWRISEVEKKVSQGRLLHY
ncbi:hypothetical protein GIB67_004231 [Kingdonia uniflora]|uniref:Mitochondrial inner membrane protease subunit 2 n=1 Tax=Kingdonia uniflora TaxID=39325 RepID=A0A7J7MQY3_9MAGN|nr:hypothetical protein GIB67_004231 [Kingdonia uniflora]